MWQLRSRARSALASRVRVAAAPWPPDLPPTRRPPQIAARPSRGASHCASCSDLRTPLRLIAHLTLRARATGRPARSRRRHMRRWRRQPVAPPAVPRAHPVAVATAVAERFRVAKPERSAASAAVPPTASPPTASRRPPRAVVATAVAERSSSRVGGRLADSRSSRAVRRPRLDLIGGPRRVGAGACAHVCLIRRPQPPRRPMRRVIRQRCRLSAPSRPHRGTPPAAA